MLLSNVLNRTFRGKNNNSKHKMSFNKESLCEKKEMFKLVGSQINLTPRSDHSVLDSCVKSCKLCSIDSIYRAKSEHKLKYTRPKSAEFSRIHHPSGNSTVQWPYRFHEEKKTEDSSLTVSNFTDLSSKLLQNLIETPSNKTPRTKESIFNSDLNFEALNDLKLQTQRSEKRYEPNNYHEFTKKNLPRINLEVQMSNISNNIIEDQLNKNLKGPNVQESFPEVAEERTVRSLDTRHFSKGSPEKKCSCNIKCSHFSREIVRHRSMSELVLPREQIQLCQEKRETSVQPNVVELQTQKTVENEINAVTILSSHSEDGENDFNRNEKFEKEKRYQNSVNSPIENDGEVYQHEIENSSDIFDQELSVYEYVNQLKPKLKELPEEYETLEDLEQPEQSSSNEQFLEQSGALKIGDSTDCVQKINLSNSTYEEIVHLLQSLEDEDSESLNMKNREESSTDIPVIDASPEEKVDYFGIVSSYLEEVELQDVDSQKNYAKKEKSNFEGFSSPRLEELLNKNSVELAHEVLALKIQVEDQKKGIKLLKETLAEMKEKRKTMELEHQEALRKINSEAEVLVQRHQKFIKQLLDEKNNLNETVSKLVQDLKLGEEKYRRNIKAIEEKHMVEIKRAKEAQAVADKVKREKWMEIKKQKIKEMTVKGLEPELSRMVARQQEEMSEIRNLHKAEIEAIELRAARRTSDLMDELRTELTKEKERVVAKETASIRAAMEKEFEEERSRLQQHCQSLKDNLRRQEEKLTNQELEFKHRLKDFRQNEEKRKQKIVRDHEENVEEIRRQHLVEIRKLRESMEAEKEVLLNNYKKQQVAKFFEKEAELHKQYKRERDREIELIIETLENEAAQIQSELTIAGESKLKRLREKMEAELKEMERSEGGLKVKLSETNSKLSEKEDTITELKSLIRQLQTELTFFKRSCEEMSLEKVKMKEIVRGEFESSITGLAKEKENLEKDLAVCKELHAKELVKKDQLSVKIKHEMQKELTKVYSRIKTAVNKKEKIIESLRQENCAISQRCRQLELMLDHQRRNLLL